MRLKTTVAALALLPLSIAFGQAENAQDDLSSTALESLLKQTIEAQKSKERQKQTPQDEVPESTPNTDKPQSSPEKKKLSTKGIFLQSQESNGLSAEEYNKQAERLLDILKTTDDPKGVLTALIVTGELALSPNDIHLIRLVADQVTMAKNKPLVDPQVINDQYAIDHQDRYKMYDLYIHDTGETLIEFVDITGAPWPIHDKSEANGFKIKTSNGSNMLWITPEARHSQSNIFVQLVEYGTPIQFRLKYSNEKRHGLATFKLPFISPTNPNQVTKSSEDRVLDLAVVSTDIAGNSNSAGGYIGLNIEELSYLASTGRFKEGTSLYEEAELVLVSNSEIAKVWFYNGQFIVRTAYMMYSFDNMVNSEGAMKVFVASKLNSIVPFNKNGKDVNLYIPDYHSYVGQ